VKAALARRGAGAAVDELLELDRRRRELLPQVEDRRAGKKRVSEEVARARREGAEAADEMAESARLGEEIKALEQELAGVEERIQELLAMLPNLPDPSAPDGDSEDDAVVVRVVGDPPELGFEPRDHLEIGTRMGLIDMESAARA
jgi:seryl-tRNA synthetase